MKSAVRAMSEKGVDIAFLLGEPEYYRRFGFDPRVAAPFSSPYAGPSFMALALCDGFKLPERGRAEYAEAFARLETQHDRHARPPSRHHPFPPGSGCVHILHRQPVRTRAGADCPEAWRGGGGSRDRRDRRRPGKADRRGGGPAVSSSRPP